ncbi:MAG: FAD-linked oxidase C-terminal domain-containing protein [Bacteroidales bacterium]|nr:FAD-linked oxidase C-terminal domain-containing protein [Bacteroidales bacterium]
MDQANSLDSLASSLRGNLKYDTITRTIYSTDASMYREEPLAVAWPEGEEDLQALVEYAGRKNTGLIMRGAGTSLAGQVVGPGIIVDISRHMNSILEINTHERWVRVQPGVILEEMNKELAGYGLFFGPETSTANRCTMGGMVGNNACGLHSLRYGSTREHTLEVKAILADGSKAVFGPLSKEEFGRKCEKDNLEGNIYRKIRDMLTDTVLVEEIKKEYPDPSVPRRNTGYALDLLLQTSAFSDKGKPDINLARLIAGSEGTLAVITEIKLSLVPLPPPYKALCCIHLRERNEAYPANLIALQFDPDAIEMMDDKILRLTGDNIEQRKNRFFLEGEPGALLIVEFARESRREINRLCDEMEEAMRKEGYGYAFPRIWGDDIRKVWNLRKSGLGVLANMKGDAKPVSLLEDTAVSVNLLPDYMKEFDSMLARYNMECVYHAHIGTGELHLRPLLNLKNARDVELFHTLGRETASLVKRFRGSLSGEHGDGRLRGEFIPMMLGEKIYEKLRELKYTWDPEGILNPNKIVDTPPMNSSLRFEAGQSTRDLQTWFSYEDTGGYLRAAEKCNGSGDCRKTERIGGTMCPSYMATRDEMNTTRARANVLREFLYKPSTEGWASPEIYEIMDLCLSCKGCKSECPANVDMARLKSEFMQEWYRTNGIPLRTRLIAYISSVNRLGSLFPGIFNFFIKNRFFSGIFKILIGFARQRSIPLLYRTSLKRWAGKNLPLLNPDNPLKQVYLFADEFTNYNDTLVGIESIKLLTRLGYSVRIPDHGLSARTFLSKGLLRKAAAIAKDNVTSLSGIISHESPLLGIEPSAILGFRDEYPGLVPPSLKPQAVELSKNALLIDEFISSEFKNGNIEASMFSTVSATILLHGHCQQKAVADTACTREMLSIPVNYSVEEIGSGCCGMAGSFGYEKEHYDLSMKVGELVLFPAVRKAGKGTVIAASGTSCRHQIKDGTGQEAMHPVQVLYAALLT